MTLTRIARAPMLRAFDSGESTTIVGAKGPTLRFDAESAGLVRAILDYLAEARTRDEVLAHIASLSGGALENPAVVDDAIAALRKAGAIRDVSVSQNPPVARTTKRTRLVLGLTGAVWTMNAPALVAGLQRRGYEVRIATTRKALRFVSRVALEGLTHSTVYSSVWQRDATSRVPHIDLAEWAEAVLICPATATTIARIATGSFTDLVAAIAVTSRAPVVIVPSMNPAMYSSPAIQRNLALLRSDGFFLAHPATGFEVAHAPGSRTPVHGAAPPPDEVIETLGVILGGVAHTSPVSADDWDRIYKSTPHAELPWTSDKIDDEVAAALGSIPKARMLDVGAGTGTCAISAAERGFSVVAMDISRAAIEAAESKPGADRVVWICDDICHTGLRGQFELVHDRGCFHVLPESRRASYVDAVGRLTRPGGWLFLKTHARAEAQPLGTARFDPADLARIFARDFDLVEGVEVPFNGPQGSSRRGIFVRLRRRDRAAG